MIGLKEIYFQLVSNYSSGDKLTDFFWSEIENNYTSKKRHYHNLNHLNSLFSELEPIKTEIDNWQVILFTLFYHDIIYNALKSNNEEKSAELAQKRMGKLSVPMNDITLCKEQILATKSHEKSANEDVNYFIDADLSALAWSWDAYSQYYQDIRREYAIYPDFMYKRGRKKVLQHFLSMDRIYKTDYFYEKYEMKAKSNLKMELDLL